MPHEMRAQPPGVDLERLNFAESVMLAQALRRCGAHARCQVEAAQKVVENLYDTLRDPVTQLQSCALVRVFQTHPYAMLPAGAQQAALRLLDGLEPDGNLRCLTLLATRGCKPEWNQVETSTGHRAIPLPDVAMVKRAPMISQLLAELGIDARQIVSPGKTLLIDEPQTHFNVFHVEYAPGSEYIPAQETFVQPHCIRSVVGMGGLLPGGELFAVILFARVPVSRTVAESFRAIALCVKLAFLPFAPNQVFPE